MKQVLNPTTDQSPLGFFLAVNRGTVWLLTLNIILYGLGTASLLAALHFLGAAVDVITGTTSGSASALLTLLVLSILAHEYTYRFGHIVEIFLLAKIRSTTKRALFDHTSSLSYGYFADRFAGELAHKVSSTADAYERMIGVLTNNFATNALLIVLSIVLIGRIDPSYVAFLTAWWILFIVGSIFFATRLNTASSAYAKAEAKTTGAVVDVYGNIAAVKVYSRQHHLETTHTQIEAEASAYRHLGWWDVGTFHFQGLSLTVLVGGLVILTASLYTQGLVTIGQIVFLSAFLFQLFDAIWQLGQNVARFIRFRGEAAKNLVDLIETPAVQDGSKRLTVPKNRAQVVYDHVIFGYGRGKPVLDDFSLIIRPGQKVGIVGLSGAGKTTFANLLLRFFDPQSGQILLGGTNIARLTQDSLRSHISYISQDPSLFHTSIAHNISFGNRKATFEQVKKAARLAYADAFIEQLPDGYNSIVGERGIKLSGGQRQRIAIARALLADRPVFLFDEATSALDSESEACIQKGLEQLMRGKTVIAIAHRLSTLARMERIVYLEDGQIVEDGTHDELLKRQGKYAALWHRQAGGFLPDTKPDQR